MQMAMACVGEQLHVLSGLTLLTELNMKGCYRVADQGLACVASLAHLHRLNLQGCWQITASGLAHLSGTLSESTAWYQVICQAMIALG